MTSIKLSLKSMIQMKMMKKMKESLSSNLLISLKVSPLKMRRSKAKKMKMVGLQ